MSTVDTLALVIGPGIGAVLLALGSPATAFAANGLTFLGAAFFASRVKTRTRSEEVEGEQAVGIAARIAEGARGIRASGAASLLVMLLIAAAGLYGFQLVFVVLLAEGPLGMGSEGVGWMTAATGLGGLIAAGVASRVATSRKGDVVLLASVGLIGLPWAAMATNDVVVLALVMMGVVGVGNIIFEVIAITILQRVVPDNLLARVFGILDSLAVAAMLAGSILAPFLVELIGLRAALVVVGLALPGSCLLTIPRLRALRKTANETMDELAPTVALLETSGAFEGATRQVLEAVASAAVRQEVAAGDVLVSEGEDADDFYVVVTGTFEVTSRGESGGAETSINELGEGDYFGEIGLLGGLHRTATVRATSAGQVLRIPGKAFLDAVGQAPSPPATLMTSFANRLNRTHPSLETTTGGTRA
jgi:hypothetical protein